MSGLIAKEVTVDCRLPGGRSVRVLDAIDLHVQPGSIFGLVGPSGRGKTTLGRVLAGLAKPTSGSVTCDGVPIAPKLSRIGRGRIGMVFQSPRRSCDPRLTLGRTIALTAKRDIRLDDVLAAVALTPDLLGRYPVQVSDGQLQRAAMARVLATKPSYLILDEPTAMLDPATTATLMDAVRQFVGAGGGALLISHDHELVNAISDQILSL
ncbi:ABC transporter ATP-binding protein [Rhizobium helianthi]|uniref:ABC transporter ATP-binding protein n=1 Tax=Rhizobium helianthi TaxID=1132695 RepID=A0ABW4M1V5_9HYPH